MCSACDQIDTDAWKLPKNHGGYCMPCSTGSDDCGACGKSTHAYSHASCSTCCTEAMAGPVASIINEKISHIVEETGGIDHLADVLTPTEEYYDALRADLGRRHPKASAHVLDHLVSLEAFLDKSILSGFSYGVDKAQLLVHEGKLLGHNVGRSGSRPDEERVQAIRDFAPLKEKLHIQQFLGSTNWLRQYFEPAVLHLCQAAWGNT